MPDRYEAIKRSIRKQHPDMPEAEVKMHSAMIFNGTRKKGEKPVTGKHHGK